MGKTKRNRGNDKKVNPIGIPSLREMAAIEDEVEENSLGQMLMDQLQSSSVDEKMNALQNIAVVSINIEKVKIICGGTDIIRTMAPLLMDNTESIRNATAGALRNLSVCGSEVCENLVEQDVITPLFALLQEYAQATNWIPSFDASMKYQLDQKSDTFLQSINLLWNLCESSSIALDSFNQTQLLAAFVRCLNYKIFGIDIAVAVAQLLLVVSEDNPNSWIVLNNFVGEFIFLLNIDDSEYSYTLLRTLAAGIVANIPALAAAHLRQILHALSKTLDVNHRTVLNAITSKLPLIDEEELTDNHIMTEDETTEAANLRHRKLDLPTDIEIEIKQIGFLLEAQRVSAEVLSNQCSPEDEEWIDENDDISDNESVHDYDASAHSSSSNLQSVTLPAEILEAVKSLGLVEKLWQKSQPIPNNVIQILRESSPVLLKKIKNLRISSLLCLQNLCNSMLTEDLGGPSAIYNVWLDIGQQVFQGPQDPSILEPATALMRASLEHLKNNSDLFSQMTNDDLQLILNGVQNCSVPEIRANWLRMLGILGCLLPESLIKIIMSFILDTLSKEYDVWTISEGIDSLMDMFTDNDWNQIAFELNLLKKSREIEKLLKNKMRQQKRELNDRYPAVLTVRTNLQRFTKYIERELKNYNVN